MPQMVNKSALLVRTWPDNVVDAAPGRCDVFARMATLVFVGEMLQHTKKALRGGDFVVFKVLHMKDRVAL